MSAKKIFSMKLLSSITYNESFQINCMIKILRNRHSGDDFKRTTYKNLQILEMNVQYKVKHLYFKYIFTTIIFIKIYKKEKKIVKKTDLFLNLCP